MLDGTWSRVQITRILIKVVIIGVAVNSTLVTLGHYVFIGLSFQS